MSSQGPGAGRAPGAPSLTSLPRIEDLPRAGEGYDADRVRDAFGVLDETEKRQLAEICRKLDRAA